MSNEINFKKLSKVLEGFEQKLESACMNKTLKKLNKMTFTGNKGKVARKLRALIAA